MGAAVSLDDPDKRTARAKELDKLGGLQRAAVRRGQSFNKRMEWLGDQLHEQGEQMEEALSKDPLAGRHDIIKQMKQKRPVTSSSAPSPGGRKPRLSVKEWQNMKHDAVRELERRAQTAVPDSRLKAEPQENSKQVRQQGWNDSHHLVAGGGSVAATLKSTADKNSDIRAKLSDYYINLETKVKASQAEKTQKLKNLYQPVGSSKKSAPLPEWRQNIMVAKKTAWKAVGTLVKLQLAARGGRPLGVKRMDSFSYYIQDLLGSDLERFQEESVRFQETYRASEDTRQLLSELRVTQASLVQDAAADCTDSISGGLASIPVVVTASKTSIDVAAASTSKTKGGTINSAKQKDQGSSKLPPVNGTKGRNSAAGEGALTLGSALMRTTRQDQSSKNAGVDARIPGAVTSTQSIASKDMNLGGTISAEREQVLMRQLEEYNSQLDQPLQLMTMFAKRCNSKWTEAQQWDAPHVHSLSGFGISAGGGQVAVYRKTVLQMLKQGEFAVQVLVGEDYIKIKENQRPVSLWSSDPWTLLSMVMPAKVASLERVQGVPMGPRLLMSLVNSVEALAGAEAVKKLCVVLHCNEEQEDGLVEDIKIRRFCGLERENVIIVVERRSPGYEFNISERRFTKKLGSPCHVAGSGYSMMQLAWPQEAYTIVEVSEPSAQPKTPGLAAGDLSTSSGSSPMGSPLRFKERQLLPSTVLDYLHGHGAKWLLCRRLHDLSLFQPDSVVDVDSLAYSLFLKEQNGANMVVQVDTFTGNKNVGIAQGVVLGHKNHKSEARVSGPLSVVDVKPLDLQSPKLVAAAAELRSKAKGRLVGSSRRYTFDIQLLRGLLVTASVFRPAISVRDGLVHITFDASDLTAAASAHCVAITNRTPAKCFTGPEETEVAISVIHAQDSSQSFRKLLGEITKYIASAASKSSSPCKVLTASVVQGTTPERHQPRNSSKGQYVAPSYGTQESDSVETAEKVLHGQRIVLLVADNSATQVAAQLIMSIVRPGKDRVHLVSIIQSLTQEKAARDLCSQYEASLKSTLVDTQIDILTKDSGTLVDQVESYMEKLPADLLVMGSMSLSKGAAAVPIGSVSVGLLRAISKPILIAKSTSKNANIVWSKDKLKCMVQVDHTSRPMLKYVCSKLLNAVRYDKVYLARADAKDKAQQETMTSRRLIESFHDIASGLHVEAIKRPLDGSFDEEGCRVADVEKCHIMATQIPSSASSLPESLMKVIKNTRSAVLVYKSRGGDEF
ncbi:hypothetical protein CEUSTIGMA_g11888.t1 [Chlamydomonas eustigma]|uniref:Uncharacterized protein n=1 Tax=Chlamydomonas eustigma TaxID=1157962 RepID=A0A250XN19_9CHLO|nr:hypothetical protein CEUSTIGMA_g11888.t1 [Chlamydomonas eustigma]|eukprot:GAX84468.1 hypothetical protein CEUSTIGMA_g11888.t1 [Chlamydomonas eustigma]